MMTAFQQRQTRFQQPAIQYVTQCILGIYDMGKRANPDQPLGDFGSPLYRLIMHSIDLLPHPLALPDYSAESRSA